MDYKEEIQYIAERIKKIRLAKNISVEELAARANLDGSNVRRIERAGTNLTIRTLTRIAEGLDVKLSDLVR